MVKIIVYSILLIIGMFVSQTVDLTPLEPHLQGVTMLFLAYIMMEVGLEFVIDKKKLGSYGKDYLIAATAAGFPWVFCALYFYYGYDAGVKESLLIARFAAPTSAGILFAMLAAAGLATTWLFKKARILAIFDDLDTIIFMIPLQIMFVGLNLRALALVTVIFLLFYLAYTHLHALHLPISGRWLLLYSFLVSFSCYLFEASTHVHIEVLLPAFAFGCILFNPHDPTHPERHKHEHAYIEHEKVPWRYIDNVVKYGFMFLVGCSLPKINFASLDLNYAIGSVLALTLLSNIGKMFPAFCYKKEATLRERLGVSVAMFPRGEVGAGVLLVAIGYDLDETLISLAGMSLALNLLLTGVFIGFVLWLVKPVYKKIPD